MEKVRKSRNDKGNSRKSYQSTIPYEFKSYKMKANKKGIPFSLSLNTFNTLINSNCYYCGEEYCEQVGRLNDNLGFNDSNSIPSCSTCITLKNNMSNNTFLKHIEKIHSYQNQEE